MRARTRTNRSSNYQRDTSAITSPRAVDLPAFDEPVFNPASDRRMFHPDRSMPRLSSTSMRDVYRESIYKLRHTVVPARKGYDYFNPVHWLVHPRETFICAKRKSRREVLAMLHIQTGLGGSGRKRDRKKPRRYNAASLIKCRR